LETLTFRRPTPAPAPSPSVSSVVELDLELSPADRRSLRREVARANAACDLVARRGWVFSLTSASRIKWLVWDELRRQMGFRDELARAILSRGARRLRESWSRPTPSPADAPVPLPPRHWNLRGPVVGLHLGPAWVRAVARIPEGVEVDPGREAELRADGGRFRLVVAAKAAPGPRLLPIPIRVGPDSADLYGGVIVAAPN